MKELQRGDKIYLDKTYEESAVNPYLDCRDGVVNCFEYRADGGYGPKTRLFLCENVKHETILIARQVWVEYIGRWVEETMEFSGDEFHYLKALIHEEIDVIGANYTQVRDYRKEQGYDIL